MITINLKLKLQKQFITNQLVIKLSLRGDYNTITGTIFEREKKYKSKKKEIEQKFDDTDTNQKKEIESKLDKNYDTNTYEEYLEFSPSDLSGAYKSYKDIYF